MTERLIFGEARPPTRLEPKRLPRLRRRLAERGLDTRGPRPKIPETPGERVEQSPATETAPSPREGDRQVVFETYTPSDTPSNGGPIPPDPSGADSAAGVV
jgi:hypothetical protein